MYLNHDSGVATFELEVPVSANGYQVIWPEVGKDGIASLDPNSPHAMAFLRAKPGSKEVLQRIRLTRSIWRDLVVVNNLLHVATPAKIRSQLVAFCDKYGLPYFGVGDIEKDPAEVCAVHLLREARLLSEAIEQSGEGGIQYPLHMINRFNETACIRMDEIEGDMTVTVSDPIVAAWLDLKTRVFEPKPPCRFCGGLNVARGGAGFCSSHCSNRWHKAKARGKIK